MLPFCGAEGIGVIPWSPLARGSWRGRGTTRWRARGEDEFGKTLYAKTEEADRAVVDRLNDLAREKGVPPAQVALAWMLSKPAVTAPIIGASKMKHLDDAVAALELKLSPNEIVALEEP